VPSSLARVVRMQPPELAWRARTTARIAVDRIRSAFKPPRWNRGALLRALADDGQLTPVRAALRARRWDQAHDAFCRYFIRQPARFVIALSARALRAAWIRERIPGASRDAARRADRLLNGDFDLLGHCGLRFGARPHQSSAAETAIDWLYDPVSGRRLPGGFWAAIDYLDERGADHKVVWELNRHQHWLTLGRAFWLTGDPKYRAAFVRQLMSWIAANPPLMGANWSSMLELAFRTLSWTWALHLFTSPVQEAEPPWVIDLLLALDRQLTQVERNLSRYFSPNTHLLGEALALYVTGCALPALRRSAARQHVGRRVLLDEIQRQIADDGGHCERSTHYHRYALDFYLLALAIARITGDSAEAAFAGAVTKLADAARILADDGGRLPHVGDDDGGLLFPMCGRSPDDVRDSLALSSALLARPDLQIGHTPEEALWQLDPRDEAAGGDTRLSVTRSPASAALPATGYYVSRSEAGDHLLIDAGPHGYRNGGHAHADALSLTLTVRGTPFLIDPGTGCYTIDLATRDRFRTTASHNTLVIDERPQSVPAGPFHWAHTADGTALCWRTGDSFDYFEGAHDGYRPLEHRRHLLVMHGDLMVVLDLITGSGSHSAAAFWHVDPRWRVEVDGRRATCGRLDAEAGPATIELMIADGQLESFVADSTTGLGWYSPVYGRIEPAPTVRITRHGTSPLWITTVFGMDRENRLVDVEPVPVWAEAGALAHSAGLRITRERSTDHVLIADPAPGMTGATWRLGEIETNARMFFGRTTNGRLARTELVGGTFARVNGRDEWPAPLDELAVATRRSSTPASRGRG